MPTSRRSLGCARKRSTRCSCLTATRGPRGRGVADMVSGMLDPRERVVRYVEHMRSRPWTPTTHCGGRCSTRWAYRGWWRRARRRCGRRRDGGRPALPAVDRGDDGRLLFVRARRRGLGLRGTAQPADQVRRPGEVARRPPPTRSGPESGELRSSITEPSPLSARTLRQRKYSFGSSPEARRILLGRNISFEISSQHRRKPSTLFAHRQNASACSSP